MGQWCSGYVENALGLPKIWGDLFGTALLAMMLGIGRSAYAKRGKNILRVMLLGMIGATVCYILASVTSNPVVGLVSCVVTGLCVSMLWPGNIIFMGEQFPTAGVAIYALMAAAGDLGASVAPQLVGLVADVVAVQPAAQTMAASLSMTAEQLGIKVGLLTSTAFPLAGVFTLLAMKRYFRKKRQS